MECGIHDGRNPGHFVSTSQSGQKYMGIEYCCSRSRVLLKKRKKNNSQHHVIELKYLLLGRGTSTAAQSGSSSVEQLPRQELRFSVKYVDARYENTTCGRSQGHYKSYEKVSFNELPT